MALTVAIYKFAYIVDNEIAKIYVFSMLPDETDLAGLFGQDPANPLFKDIFSQAELDNIKATDIPVVFVASNIYLDDTIEVVKKKLIAEVMKEPPVSFGEIYLFIKQVEQLNTITIYQNLTQNEKLDLTNARLVQFLLNLNETYVEKIATKEIYNYDDLLLLDLDNKPVIINKPLGQKFVALDMSLPYTVNPYDVLVYDRFLEQFANEITTTTNTNLLLESGPFENNMIYVCLAADVLKYTAEKEPQLAASSTLKIYYPYLMEQEISSLTQLNDKKQHLLLETEKMLNMAFTQNIANINLFYAIFKNKTTDLPYLDNGIKEIEFTLYPTFVFQVPLEVVFKLLHATNEIPFIKYNQYNRQEKIYRLYADKITSNGKKIPNLTKSTILKLSKTIGRGKSVAVYIEYSPPGAEETIPFVCEFESNGSISIKATFLKSVALDVVERFTKAAVNPVITTISEFLAQNGYQMPIFQTLAAPNVEIGNIVLETRLPIIKNIYLKKLMPCLSSIFNITDDNIEKGFSMRFKRVTNYNEMDSQEAYIVEMMNRGGGGGGGGIENEIIQGLAANYALPEQKAREKYAEFLTSLQVVQTAFQHRKLKIKNNPGFLITIKKERSDNILSITTSGINNIQYLNTIPIYLDTFIRITQYPETAGVPIDIITKQCKGNKAVEEEVHVGDIVAVAEKPYADNKQIIIVDEQLAYANEVYMKSAKALLGLADEEEEAEEDPEESGREFLDMFGFEDAGEGEGEGEGEDAGEQEGGAGDDLLQNDMTGQSLKNPNFFFKKLEKLDKPLFLTENEGKFKSYSRTCPSNMNLQPVILTEDEKAKIDKEHPGSYSEAVKYGSDPKKPYWYICPRYWSLKDGVSLTEADVKSGKYGTIIPPKAKTVPPGGNIFEFTSELYHKDENGKYVQHYPGFKATDKHPNGKCIPCCFSNWNSNQQTERRDICRQDGDIAPADETPDVEPGLAEPEPALVEPGLAEPEPALVEPGLAEPAPALVEPALVEPVLDPEVDLEKKDKPPTPLKKNETRKIVIKTKKKHDEVDEYIKGIDKFPLEPARYGFLPISIQKFIHTDNKKCQISISNTNIKTHHVCMLRRGVEVSRNQSFIGCIADFYAVDPRKPILSIKQMKEQLIEAMDLDIFLKLQNGNLVAIFGSDKINNLDLTEFANTRIFANTDKANNEQLALLNRIVNAYENFKKYLRDETIEINYTYLWDLICQPNPKLFIPGLNMAILELKNNDITDNVHLICPTNHYSYSFFDINKPTIMLLKIGDYYEVILSYEDKVKHIEILKFFSLRNKSLLPNIKKTLELIMKSAYEKCGPLTSMPKVYTFVQNIPLEQTVALLKSKDYEINGQIINYSGKIIGIWAEKSALSGFIPCQPSPPLLPSVAGEVLWMDDTRKPVRQPYEATVKFLNQVHRELKGKIPCKPAFKVIEDELIVGVLTTTNQFVALSEPAEDTFGEDLPVLPGNDYIAADKKIANEDPENIDHERINYIQKIKLENNFFNVFRNMLRNIFGQFRYREVRAEIEQIIASPTLLYLAKIKQVDTLLRKLTQNLISFIEYDEKVLQQLGAITNCNLQTNKTMCAAKPFCMASDTTDTCAILVPRINLINGKQNEAVYFGRLADELVRYDRVKAFMFNPKSLLSLSFADIKYNLKDDELILLHSLLLEGYFDDLVPLKKNHYIKNNTFETAQPLKTQIYANAVASNLDRKDGNICEVMEKKKVAGIWQALFPPSSSEYTFPSSPASCSFNILLQLIKEVNQTSNISRNGLKELLLAEYEKYTADYLDEIIQILSSQGKNTVARQVLIGQTTLHNLIMSEDYYATNIDLWLLATRFKLPIVFFSVGSLLENNGPFLITYKDDSNSYFFIRAQSVVANVAPVYKLVVDSKTARARIPVASLAKSLQEDILESLRTMSENPLQGYIENFRQKRQLIKRKINVRPPAPASASASVPAPAPASAPAPAPARKKLGKITLI